MKKKEDSAVPEIIFLIILAVIFLVFIIWVFTSPTFFISLIEAIFSIFNGTPPNNLISLLFYGLIVFFISTYIAKLIIRFIEWNEKED